MTKIAIEILVILGFAYCKKVISADTANAGNSIGAVLSTNKVNGGDDGPCLPMTDLMPHLYRGVNLLPILPPGTYYVPMASKSLYRKYAEDLLGRPVENQKELDSMELTLHCGPLFSTIENTGFPSSRDLNSPSKKFSQTCVAGGIPSLQNLGRIISRNFKVDFVQGVCVWLPQHATRTSSSTFTYSMDSFIWMNDDLTVLLIYRCTSADGLKDYKVLSKTKTLKPKDISIIREKINELGFAEENIGLMQYKTT